MNVIPGSQDGTFSFSLDEIPTGTFAIGLSFPDVSLHFNSIDFCYKIEAGQLEIWENGARIRPAGQVFAGDELVVERSGFRIRYLKNGELLRTVPHHHQRDLVVEVSFLNKGIVLPALSTNFCSETGLQAEIVHENCDSSDAKIKVIGLQEGATYSWSNGSTSATNDGLTSGIYDLTVNSNGSIEEESFEVVQQIEWTDYFGNTSISGGVAKTAINNWGNGGAASVNMLPPSTDGKVIFSTRPVDAARIYIIGLSSENLDAHFNTIEYAFYNRQGALLIYESGVEIGSFGTLGIADKLVIAREGNEIVYTKNNRELRRVATNASNPLIVDISIFTQHTEITEVFASFCPPAQNNKSAKETTIKEDQSSFKLYPNPSNGQFTVEVAQDLHEARLEIFNLLGDLIAIHEIEAGKTQVNASNYATGSYIVRLSNGSTKTSQRIVIH